MRLFGKVVAAVLLFVCVGISGLSAAFRVLSHGPGARLYGEARGSVISTVLLLGLLGAYACAKSFSRNGRQERILKNFIGMGALIVGVWWFFVNAALSLA